MNIDGFNLEYAKNAKGFEWLQVLSTSPSYSSVLE
jgi:hypothetical protein